MGHLFYDELGGVTGISINTTHNAAYNLFENIQNSGYWSGSFRCCGLNASVFPYAFGFDSAQQISDTSNSDGYYAWAARSGDAVSSSVVGVVLRKPLGLAVPLPETIAVASVAEKASAAS
jgi:hypothetical protein